jgi:hypothetical protein
METVLYAVWYVVHVSVLAVWQAGDCVRDSPIHRLLTTMHVKHMYNTAFTTVTLRMNHRGSKHIADNRNQILINKIV